MDIKKIIFAIFLLVVPFMFTSAANPKITSVTNTNGKVKVKGTIDFSKKELVQIAIFDSNGELISLGTTALKNNEYSYTSEKLSLTSEATYTVKTALYDGTCEATMTFKAKEETNPQTWDPLYTYIAIFVGAALAIGFGVFYLKKMEKEDNKGDI